MESSAVESEEDIEDLSKYTEINKHYEHMFNKTGDIEASKKATVGYAPITRSKSNKLK